MDAAYIDGGAVQALARHHAHRLAHRVAACKVSGVRWLAPVAVRALRCGVVWLGSAWPAAAAPHVPEAAPMPVVAAGQDQARPNIRPMLSDEDRQSAVQQGKRLRAQAPALPASAPTQASTSKRVVPSAAEPAAQPHVPPPVTAAPERSAPSAAPASAPVDGAVAYALVTEITRSRLASELRQQLMSVSPAVGDVSAGPRAELMQVSNGWRAVVWPFATEGEAEKARQVLAVRGIRTEVLKF